MYALSGLDRLQQQADSHSSECFALELVGDASYVETRGVSALVAL